MAIIATENDLNQAFRSWLLRTMSEAKLNQLQVAAKTGASAAMIGHILHGRRKASSDLMEKILKAFKLNINEALLPYIEELYRDDVGPFTDTQKKKHLRQEVDAREHRNELRQHPAPDMPHLLSTEDMEERGFFTVPFSDNMKLAAGEGGSIPITDEANESVIVVHGPSIKRHNPKNLQAFRVGGPSMEPLIADGGIVLADLSHNDIRHIKNDRIYVVCWDLDDGECAVKYLRWFEKGKIISIESEDRFYKPILKRIDEVVLIGKVFWAWREFPD